MPLVLDIDEGEFGENSTNAYIIGAEYNIVEQGDSI